MINSKHHRSDVYDFTGSCVHTKVCGYRNAEHGLHPLHISSIRIYDICI